ncbi:MAG: hypothetical protein JXR19_04120 [Bacteroidia bacterium]
MKEGLASYFNVSSELRKKSIHLLYLVFLVLIFAFIPGHKSGVKHLELSEHSSLAEQNQQGAALNAILLLHLVQDNPVLFNEIKFRTIESEHLAKDVERYIEDIKNSLKSEESLVEESTSDSLFSLIHEYKTALDQLGNYSLTEVLDSLLGDENLVQDQEGKFFTNYQYYFAKSDYVKSTFNLELLAVRVKRALALNTQVIIENAIVNHGGDELQNAQLYPAEDWSQLLKSNSVSEYLGSYSPSSKPEPRPLTNSKLNLKANHLKHLRAGEYVDYQLDWKTDQKLLITVENNGEKEYFSLMQKRSFRYYMLQAGTYKIDFQLGDYKFRDIVEVRPTANYLQQRSITVFKAQEKRLDLSQFHLPQEAQLEFEFDKGEVLRRGEQIALLAKNTGDASLKLWASMPYGKIEVAVIDVVVLPEQKPSLKLNEFETGSLVNKDQLLEIREASIVNLANAQLYSFNVTIINPTAGSSSKTYFNRGAILNSSILNALATKAVKGSTVLVNQVRINVEGKIVDGQAFTIQVI